MTLAKKKNDAIQIVKALQRHPDEWMWTAGENGVARRSGVPKGQVRRAVEEHPEVSIRKASGRYEYRYQGP